MRSILLYANEDTDTLTRLEAALSIASMFQGHLQCLQVTSASEYVFVDPFGGAYPMLDVLNDIGAEEKKFQSQIEARLGRAGASWTWINEARDLQRPILDLMKLVDLAVVSIGSEAELSQQTPAAARLAIRVNTPVLAVSSRGTPFDLRGPALIAWNGSPEAARALRAAVPLISAAASVTIVEIVEGESSYRAFDAAEYLGYYGIKPEVREQRTDGETVADALRRAALEIGATYIVMGAYGKPRLQEQIFGGVTQSLSDQSPCSLLMAH